MFYVNNKQVLGIFLNGRSYSCLTYGFGKIIPEDRNAEQLNLNLAQRNLNQYRVEYGNIQSGYSNSPIVRLDYPVNGIFHSPLTYYYGGNIVPTKNVPVLITNGNYALRNARVYNDMNINGAINYFASNTDFQGHNVNVFPEKDYDILLNYEMLNNCSNFDLNISTRFNKGAYPALYNCINFSGNYRYVGSQDYYPGFRGFLHQCRDGIFNIDCANMRATAYFNFNCISNSNNIKLNINGSPWQAWVHPNCYSGNCYIETRHIVPGFDHMNHCNFNIELPSNANFELPTKYSILSNSSNCNVYFDGINSNLYSFRNDSTLYLFQDLNNCNLNLLLGGSTGLDYAFGNRLNNCNIHFMGMGFKQQGFGFINNCTLTGNFRYAKAQAAFVYSSRNVKFNIDARNTSNMILLQNVDNATGNVNLSNDTNIEDCSNSILNLYNGNVSFNVVENCNINAYNYMANFRNVNNTTVEAKSECYIRSIDNCHNLSIYSHNMVGGVLIENMYNSSISMNLTFEANYRTRNVNNCELSGFPTSATHTTNCIFRTSLPVALFRNSSYVTWANVWPHATPYAGYYRTNAGLESVANFSRCYLNANNASQVNSSSISLSNNNNMIMSLLTFYSGTVKANLSNYATNIKLNVDCNTLNLGIFQAGPPHGLEFSSISADNIYCATGRDYYVQMNYGTRIYCENFCNVAFSPVWRRFGDNYQPVLLINNYQHSNSDACKFNGGIYRIGRLRFQGIPVVNMYLANGACMFINNVTLSKAEVNNALLFIGSNVSITNRNVSVSNGGLIVSRNNYSMSAIGKFVNRNNFTWNFIDSGPWGQQSLLNFCINV